MLLAVSGLGKQSLILGYDWLKDHNPRIDWEKGEVEMTRCLLWCEGGCALRKEQTHQKRIELRALRLCHDGPTPLFQEELELEDMPPPMYCPDWEPRDRLFLTHILLELTQANL